MKHITSIIIVLIVVAGATFLLNRNPAVTNEENNTVEATVTTPTDVNASSVKEFTMESFVKFTDGKPEPRFSPDILTVRKGDTVRIKITNTQGTHDFKLDEFNLYTETPLNQEVVVEFVADKAGDFTYYCTKPGHRAAGHWGTLKVVE